MSYEVTQDRLNAIGSAMRNLEDATAVAIVATVRDVMIGEQQIHVMTDAINNWMRGLKSGVREDAVKAWLKQQIASL